MFTQAAHALVRGHARRADRLAGTAALPARPGRHDQPALRRVRSPGSATPGCRPGLAGLLVAVIVGGYAAAGAGHPAAAAWPPGCRSPPAHWIALRIGGLAVRPGRGGRGPLGRPRACRCCWSSSAALVVGLDLVLRHTVFGRLDVRGGRQRRGGPAGRHQRDADPGPRLRRWPPPWRRSAGSSPPAGWPRSTRAPAAATSCSWPSPPRSSAAPRLFGGRGRTYAALLGILVIQSITNGMLLLNVDSSVRFMVTAGGARARRGHRLARPPGPAPGDATRPRHRLRRHQGRARRRPSTAPTGRPRTRRIAACDPRRRGAAAGRRATLAAARTAGRPGRRRASRPSAWSRGGRVRLAPNVPGWDGLELPRLLREEFGDRPRS